MQGARKGTVGVMAVACGVMVANIYLCQPLLAEMAGTFGVSARMAALVSVATQVGYTLGILLVVPLADMADPQRLVRRLLAFSTAGLLAAALSPRLEWLVAASLLVSATSIVAQILIPLSTTLTTPEYRARIVSVLATGLIVGILLSRTVSGLVADASGTWRASFLFQAALVVALRFVLPAYMPEKRTSNTTSYWKLLSSLPPLLRHRPLLLSMGLSFCLFASFSALWATLAFHLASPAFNMGPAAAGLFGLWGAPGALLAPMLGRQADSWGPARVNLISICAVALSFAVGLLWGATSTAALVIAVNLLDFGVQSGQVANQARIFALGAEIRGRLNTLYMVATFAGGACGALIGGLIWTTAGWSGICHLALGLCVIAALQLLSTRNGKP